MDGIAFARITKALTGSAPRRQAIMTLAGTGLAAVASRLGVDRAVGKRRCRKRLQTCGGKRKCCNNSGFIRCGEATHPSKPQCEEFSGRRCCGLDGAPCEPTRDGCDCCGELFCADYGTEALCRSEAT